jgi:hypothetical protein
MRSICLLLSLSVCWCHAHGQAPQSASLWRVATASLTSPPALQTGPAGAAWNPAAAVDETGLSAAVHIVQTSDVVGLSSIVVGVTRSVGQHMNLGFSGGRTDVRDLVRTSSSPASEGKIPVYTQFLGLAGQYETSGFVIGALFRFHNAQFNFEREHGFTLDFGARYSPSSRLVIAAATHFLPIDLSGQETTDYYAGLEYVVLPRLSIGGVGAQILASYGVTYVAAERLEHMIGTGLALSSHFRLDASIVRETGYVASAWRPAVAVSVLVGKYQLGMARSNGINDLGATYRVALDAAILR